MILARMMEKITVDRHYNIVIRFFISPEGFAESISEGDKGRKAGETLMKHPFPLLEPFYVP